MGISYASYARSGFFQLVAVAAVNLACLLACLFLFLVKNQLGGFSGADRPMGGVVVLFFQDLVQAAPTQ